MTATLGDVGEKTLIRELFEELLRKSDQTLDDCAVIQTDGVRLAMTIDAGPAEPFLYAMGIGTMEDLGHYFATMSLSDLAAAGAEPVALLAAFLLPATLAVVDVKELATGVELACQEVGARYVGGDTKQADRLRVITTGIGKFRTQPLSRRGAAAGDLLVVTGCLGAVIRSYIDARRHGTPILRPKAKVTTSMWVAHDRIASACTDISDGPLIAARSLASASRAEIELDLERLPIVEAPAGLSSSLWRTLTVGVGGDFELMFTTPPGNEDLVRTYGGTICGRVLRTDVEPSVFLRPDIAIHSWEHFATTGAFEAVLKDLK
jgi:thiamine-monophosphate kinase